MMPVAAVGGTINVRLKLVPVVSRVRSPVIAPKTLQVPFAINAQGAAGVPGSQPGVVCACDTAWAVVRLDPLPGAVPETQVVPIPPATWKHMFTVAPESSAPLVAPVQVA